MLVTRVGAVVCAVPIEYTVETMRPLPIEPIDGAPAFVRGLSIVRGAPIPVVDAARLLGVTGVEANRFVVLRVGERSVALLVDAVIAVRAIAADRLTALPPLLRGSSHDTVRAVGTLDAELVVVLDAVRVLPDLGAIGAGA
jgi:purine-binding chemotaxis protein CheW